jgi:hypothetical protein
MLAISHDISKGDQVVCIDETYHEESLKLVPNRPVKDSIYTVRDVSITTMGKAIWLEEITNPLLKHHSGMGMFEPSFSILRFMKHE